MAVVWWAVPTKGQTNSVYLDRILLPGLGVLKDNFVVGELEVTTAHGPTHLTAHTGKIQKLHSQCTGTTSETPGYRYGHKISNILVQVL